MRSLTLRSMRVLGALTVLAVGAVHLQQYADGTDEVPTIGALFLLNGIAAAVIGVALLLPWERWLTRPRADSTLGLLALGAVAIAGGSLVALFVSETSSLFGFSENGYDSAVLAAIAAEVATILLLTPVIVQALGGVLRGREDPRRGMRHRPRAIPRGSNQP